MATFEDSAFRIPSLWASANEKPAFACAHSTALSINMLGRDDCVFRLALSALAILCSAFEEEGNCNQSGWVVTNSPFANND